LAIGFLEDLQGHRRRGPSIGRVGFCAGRRQPGSSRGNLVGFLDAFKAGDRAGARLTSLAVIA